MSSQIILEVNIGKPMNSTVNIGKLFIAFLLLSGCAGKHDQQARQLLAQEVDKQMSQIKQDWASIPCAELPTKWDQLRESIQKEILK